MVNPPENLLARETSPYLRQHSHNPVHWRPWSQTALDEAKALDRPILLSIGYAACHWCHVMAHESFENDEIAALMNRRFVNIKVDREERPDIDQIYMAALAATGEQGGWPLTMFLTPEGKAFWGGTYFPPESRYGRPGFPDVLNSVHAAWMDRRAKLTESAAILSSNVEARLSPDATAATISAKPLGALANNVANMIDPTWGGLKGAPKFPNAPFMNALWINSLNTNNPEHRAIVVESLRMMLAGGIYDHVGGGLCRYSTDGRWLVPHFEKMLYDNAQLVRHCCLAYAETRDRLFADRITQTLTWLDREMSIAGGGFAASLDADSDGEEGKFYTWTRSAVSDVLGSDTDSFLNFYELTKPENWEGGPILHRLSNSGHSGAESESVFGEMLERLRAAREARVRPARDDKILVDWNGLTIRAFAEAGRLFKRPDWVARASDAFHFVVESSSSTGRLPHSILGQARLFPGMSSDYAAMINAAASLFEATGDQSFLESAVQWVGLLNEWHGDERGGHYLTASDATDVPMRIRGDVDDPVPSATAQIIEALVRLSSATGDADLYLRATRAAELAVGRAAQQQYGQAGIYCAAAIAYEPIKLVIVERGKEDELAGIASAHPDPRRVDLSYIVENRDAAKALPPGMTMSDAPAAWLCAGMSCLPPIHEPQQLIRALTTGRPD